MKRFKLILFLFIPFLGISQNEGIRPYEMQNAKSKNYLIRSGSNKEFRYDSIIPYFRDSLGFLMGAGPSGVSGTFNNVTTSNGSVIAGSWKRYLATQSGTGAIARIPFYANDTILTHQQEFILNNTIGASRIGIGHSTGNNWSNTYFTNTDAGGLTILDANRSEINLSTSSTNRNTISFDGSGNLDVWRATTGSYGTLPLMRLEGTGTFRLPILSTTGNSIVLASNNGSLVNAVGTATDQVLKWNNTTSTWGVGTIATGPTYTAGGGISIASNIITNTGVHGVSGSGISVSSNIASLTNALQTASSSNLGILVKTANGSTGTVTPRTLVAGSNITITNANGVSGDIVINSTAGSGTVTNVTAGQGISTSVGGLNSQITTSGTLYNVAARVAELSRNSVYTIAATAATEYPIDFLLGFSDYGGTMTSDVTSDYISIPSGGSQNSTYFYTVTLKPSITTDITMYVKQGTTNQVRTITKQTCKTNEFCTLSFSSRGIWNTPVNTQNKLIIQSSAAGNIEIQNAYFTLSGNY